MRYFFRISDICCQNDEYFNISHGIITISGSEDFISNRFRSILDDSTLIERFRISETIEFHRIIHNDELYDGESHRSFLMTMKMFDMLYVEISKDLFTVQFDVFLPNVDGLTIDEQRSVFSFLERIKFHISSMAIDPTSFIESIDQFPSTPNLDKFYEYTDLAIRSNLPFSSFECNSLVHLLVRQSLNLQQLSVLVHPPNRRTADELIYLISMGKMNWVRIVLFMGIFQAESQDFVNYFYRKLVKFLWIDDNGDVLTDCIAVRRL